MEKKNREQRRREKFGHAGGATKDPWPHSEANPAFGQGEPTEDVDAELATDEYAKTDGPEKDMTQPAKSANVGRRKKA